MSVIRIALAATGAKRRFAWIALRLLIALTGLGGLGCDSDDPASDTSPSIAGDWLIIAEDMGGFPEAPDYVFRLRLAQHGDSLSGDILSLTGGMCRIASGVMSSDSIRFNFPCLGAVLRGRWNGDQIRGDWGFPNGTGGPNEFNGRWVAGRLETSQVPI